MRIWHEQLIPKLCRQHLLACWREGLGAYKIITENKKGYRFHPAVKEFENHRLQLLARLTLVRHEMVHRGYDPKPLPVPPYMDSNVSDRSYKEWQSLEQQIKVLKDKKCKCKI